MDVKIINRVTFNFESFRTFKGLIFHKQKIGRELFSEARNILPALI